MTSELSSVKLGTSYFGHFAGDEGCVNEGGWGRRGSLDVTGCDFQLKSVGMTDGAG